MYRKCYRKRGKPLMTGLRDFYEICADYPVLNNRYVFSLPHIY